MIQKYIVTVFLLLNIFVFGQIDASIDKHIAKIGEPITYTLKLDYKKGDHIKFPIIQDTIIQNIEVLSQKIDTVSLNDKSYVTKKIELAVYEEGKYRLPPFSVLKNQVEFKTKSFEVEITAVPVDTVSSKIYPIKPVMVEKYTVIDYFYRYWLYIIGALFLILLAIILLILYIRSRSKIIKKKKELSPYDEITIDLKKLNNKKLIEKGNQKEYYTGLTFLLKRYIGRIYSIPTLELLSDDLYMKFIDKDAVSQEDKSILKQFLYDTDLVKFAKGKLGEAKVKMYEQWIYKFIEELKPMNIPENEIEDELTGENYRKIKNR